jgi:hypothetical protein
MSVVWCGSAVVVIKVAAVIKGTTTVVVEEEREAEGEWKGGRTEGGA